MQFKGDLFMLIRIAICDDVRETCWELRDILKQIENEHQYKFEIKSFYSIEDLNNSFYKNDIDFDVIFLDIEFQNEMKGVYLGNKIRNDFFKENIKIVYISAYEKYGKDLFEVRPFNFLIKPIYYGKVEKTMQDIIKIITKQNSPFEYTVEGKKYTVDLYKILYFESNARKIRIATIDDVSLSCDIFYGKISDIAEQLSKSDFFLIHKSYLVNYHNVAEFQYDNITMVNRDNLSISQTYRKIVREMRNRKMGED